MRWHAANAIQKFTYFCCMGIKSFLAKPAAAWLAWQQQTWASRAEVAQQTTFKHLLRMAAATEFGKEHRFADIRTHADFAEAVPIRDYEALRPYIDRIIEGNAHVLWPGRPRYFAKTSGTTSGVKYIPLTNESVPYHFNSARNAVFSYVHETGNAAFLDHRLIFLSGSPEMTQTGGILTGRLSGISNHLIPAYFRSNQLPSYATNCIEDWEEKLEKIIEETLYARMSLISGIPPWVQMYFDRLIEKTGKPIKDIFPDFSVFVYGGVNFEPYREKLYDSIGKHIDSIETYPSSEGFIAYQDTQQAEGMLMLLNHGIFYEFVPAEEFFNEKPTRLTIEQVELGKNYALIMNTNAGLWGYSIGDTIQFVSKNPYRILVTGRIKHFISAFGEHVIGKEVEESMTHALAQHPEVRIKEFSVAPQVNPPEGGTPYHEWLIAFEQPPHDLAAFAQTLDAKLCALNIYYDDLIRGKILKTLQITALQADAFQYYMKSIGKLGGQNKVPRLANDRSIADAIRQWARK